MKLAQTSLLRLRSCAFKKVYRANQQNPKFRVNGVSRLRALWRKPF
jgi:hypothetical protein